MEQQNRRKSYPSDLTDEQWAEIEPLYSGRGTFVSDVGEQLGLGVDISEKIKPHQWEKLPWRRVVECTLAWLNHSRRLSKDYEISTASEEAFVIISHAHSLLKRL